MMALPSFQPCTVWPELRPENVDEGLLRFCLLCGCLLYGVRAEL